MKVHIQFKDPDGVYESIEEAVKQSVDAIPGLSTQERAQMFEMRRLEEGKKLSRWIKYGEYLGVVLDTETMTARVLAVGEEP